MTKEEFEAELGEIQRLLREHAFLAYSASGAREYQEKLATCTAFLVELLATRTGLPLAPYAYLARAEELTRASRAGAASVAKRAARRAATLAAKAEGQEAAALNQAAALWNKAAELLNGPKPR